MWYSFPNIDAKQCTTVGREERIVRQYIQQQEAEDQRIEQFRLNDEW